ncbi:MAG TPA: rhodanese-related sulfurtransferase [Candidatus Saccharimonadales bacterium]
MHKVILYYKFVVLKDPAAIKLWQQELCKRLGLKGRIIVADQGINGTLGGKVGSLKTYIKAIKETGLFKGIKFKWSDGGPDDFPRLSVKVRPELVTLAPEEKFDIFNSSRGLRPKDWHQYLKDHPQTVVLDARNHYESQIGHFKAKNLIKPKINNFREIKPLLEVLPKDQPVLTYCTGDIRCEYLSAYMSHKGFEEVYHLDGGIVKYGQEFKDDGLWEGKCFVFDNRMSLAFSDKVKDIGDCWHCGSATSAYINCADKTCNRLMLVCDDCQGQTACSAGCQTAINQIQHQSA